MLKAKSLECRQKTPVSEKEKEAAIHERASELWQLTKRKALVDIFDITDDSFKQKVISYANNKYGKATK
jgi:hypothetical protein